MLLTGYIRHGLNRGASLSGLERWVWIIYPWGLVLLPLTHFLVGWWSFIESGRFIVGQSPLAGAIPSAISIVLAGLLVLISHRGIPVSARLANVAASVFSLEWFYRTLRYAYRSLNQLVAFTTIVLESEGGVLWAFLLLTLLLAFFMQGGP